MDFLSTHSFLVPGTLGQLLCTQKGIKLQKRITLESAMGRKYRSIKQNSGQIYDRAINGNPEKLSHTSLEADGSEE